MVITEVNITPAYPLSPTDRIRAFVSVAFDDCFIVRDIKVISGVSGLFVAMPGRKLTGHCENCREKNHFRAAYCNRCGIRLDEKRALIDDDGRPKLHADIAHPITHAARIMIEEAVLAAYHAKMERAETVQAGGEVTP